MSAPAVLPVRTKLMITSSACACRRDGAWKYSPAAAVPVRMKMPEPMMAPMPSAVSDQGPSDLLRRCSGVLGIGDQLVDRFAAEQLVVGGTDDGSGFRGL
jgi:hypothetical protein